MFSALTICPGGDHATHGLVTKSHSSGVPSRPRDHIWPDFPQCAARGGRQPAAAAPFEMKGPRPANHAAQSIPPQFEQRARAVQPFGKFPLSFEANQGQTESQVKFLSRGRGHSLFLTANEAAPALSKSKPENHQDTKGNSRGRARLKPSRN